MSASGSSSTTPRSARPSWSSMGTFRSVNPALCRITGYDREALLALRFQDITHPDDLAADLELLHQVVRGERSTYEIEKRYRKPSVITSGRCSPSPRCGRRRASRCTSSPRCRTPASAAPSARAPSTRSFPGSGVRRLPMRSTSSTSRPAACSGPAARWRSLLGYTPEEIDTFRRSPLTPHHPRTRTSRHSTKR